MLIHTPNRYKVGDAGIFYYIESFLFPSEHKKEENIFKNMKAGTAIENNRLEQLEYDVKKNIVRYIWNREYFSELIEL